MFPLQGVPELSETLSPPPRLHPGEAVGALLVTPRRQYLLQHRDDRPDIFFPDFWGNFGGGIDQGETPLEALRREISEELQYTVTSATFFCSLGMDFSFAGLGIIPRHFFEVTVDESDIAGMQQAEGQGKALFDADTILRMPKVAPYDALAIWQHAERGRFR